MIIRGIKLGSLLLFITLTSYSQVSVSDSSITIPMFYVAYSYQFPGADMADRWGSNSYIGPGFQVKTASRWIYGAEAGFIFGSNFKPGFSIFEDIMTSTGNVINGDGVPAVIALFERGFIITGKFGRHFRIFKNHPNSGLVAEVGAGYMQHKLRIDVENNSAPQLRDDYARGYDRLSGGFSLSQALGIIYMGKKRLVNFYVGVEIYEGWTKSKRDYIFDLMAPDVQNRFDVLVGPKVKWIIPIYRRTPEEYYYY